MNKLTSDSKHSMLTRIITACIMAIVFIPCIFLGGWFYFALALIMVFVAVYEMISASNKGRFNIFIYIITYVMVFSFVIWYFIKNIIKNGSMGGGTSFFINTPIISTIGIIVFFLLLFSVTLMTEKFTVSDACYIFTMGIYLALATLCLLFIRYLPTNSNFYGKEGPASALFLVYVLLGTIMNDTGAYFIGVMFGKHKMTPRISPHKTWEGFIGGISISFLFSFFFAFVMDWFGYPVLKGVLDFSGYNWCWVVLLGVVMPLAGDFGDLLFSAIKRSFAIKDFGKIFPGHGGVLDRIDSLSFIATTVTVLTVLIMNNWNLTI